VFCDFFLLRISAGSAKSAGEKESIPQITEMNGDLKTKKEAVKRPPFYLDFK